VPGAGQPADSVRWWIEQWEDQTNEGRQAPRPALQPTPSRSPSLAEAKLLHLP
jgi:hypothetical protein